jgi:hypothetical protein
LTLLAAARATRDVLGTMRDMAHEPLKSPSDYEDPAEAVIAAAEWIAEDEDTTVILEELRRRREAREAE